MNSAIERLLTLQVKDIMNTDVLTVADSDDMQAAAQSIFAAEVTGGSRGECDRRVRRCPERQRLCWTGCRTA